MSTTYTQTDGDLVAWTDTSDNFSHSELAANWLTTSKALNRLDNERMPLGSIVMWWRRTVDEPIIPWGTDTVWQPCDGRSITSSHHDFPGGGTIVLPDMRNLVPVGAGTPAGSGASVPALTYPGDGVAASSGATYTHAGGIGGALGSMAKVTLPDHFHDHDHIHRTGGVAGVETMHAVETDNASGGLNDSLHASPPYINTDASGTGHNVTVQGHAHQLAAMYTSHPRIPENDNQRVVDAPGQPASSASDASSITRVQTSIQRIANGVDDEVSVTGDSSNSVVNTPAGSVAAQGNHVADARPAGLGVVFIMKVKNAPSV